MDAGRVVNRGTPTRTPLAILGGVSLRKLRPRACWEERHFREVGKGRKEALRHGAAGVSRLWGQARGAGSGARGGPSLGKRPSVVQPQGAGEAKRENLKLVLFSLSVPEGSSPQVAQEKPLCLSSPAAPDDLHAESLRPEDDFWGPTGPVAIKVVDQERSLYRFVSGVCLYPSTPRPPDPHPTPVSADSCTPFEASWVSLLPIHQAGRGLKHQVIAFIREKEVSL